ncbi:NAD(P)/FAD-dependent oxidoreductase [Ferruginibacter albus]|uniref:NAD(P)/FAD-dependent oxidoreductase n=1 Tax=Ferruginibacter albus TaxID=2875540 RepID=UPI001CC486BC|nr:FAD-dependent oxidoreductase [Ferruginibacter albus]UAY52871.1 FAD-binding oxidoreductase [Ferruginibacter albus]
MDLSSGYPYFLIKTGLPFNYQKLEASLKTDVLILGGGISGALTAYYLTSAGINCVVIDSRGIGLGSSAASTSLLQYELDTSLVTLINKVGKANAVNAYQLCVEAINKLGKLSDKIGNRDFEFKQSLYYAATKKDVSFLKNEFAVRKENGLDVSYLNGSDINSKFGFTAPGAILSATAGQTDCYMLTHSLHQSAIKKGLKVYDNTSIVKIDHGKRSIAAVAENGCIIKAKKIVYATGYEVMHLIDKKIVTFNSTYACASEQQNNQTKLWKDDVLLWNTADPYLYLRSTNDKRIIIGGRDEKFYDPNKRDKLLKRKTKQLAKDFKELFPAIPFKPEFSWTGTFGVTKDGLPFIGQYKKLPNSFFALGFGGNGIVFSLIAAEILQDIFLGKKSKSAPIFSFERL